MIKEPIYHNNRKWTIIEPLNDIYQFTSELSEYFYCERCVYHDLIENEFYWDHELLFILLYHYYNKRRVLLLDNNNGKIEEERKKHPDWFVSKKKCLIESYNKDEATIFQMIIDNIINSGCDRYMRKNHSQYEKLSPAFFCTENETKKRIKVLDLDKMGIIKVSFENIDNNGNSPSPIGGFELLKDKYSEQEKNGNSIYLENISDSKLNITQGSSGSTQQIDHSEAEIIKAIEKNKDKILFEYEQFKTENRKPPDEKKRWFIKSLIEKGLLTAIADISVKAFVFLTEQLN